jgi:hypothetical protein
MGIFEDKKFTELDWMTQITEGIESELNNALAMLPDEVVCDIDVIKRANGTDGGFHSFNVTKVLACFIPKDLANKLSWEDMVKIRDCFEFEIEPGTSMDLQTNTMTGSIILLKKTATLDDDALQSIMTQKCLDGVASANWRYGPPARQNEIMDLLGAIDPEMRKSRSSRRKFHAIKKRLAVIFDNNEWRVRDTQLAYKIGAWVASYLEDGNLAALTNICKVKIMTHNNMPIYSIEEEV